MLVILIMQRVCYMSGTELIIAAVAAAAVLAIVVRLVKGLIKLAFTGAFIAIIIWLGMKYF